MHRGILSQRLSCSSMFTGLKRLQMTTSKRSRRQNWNSCQEAFKRMPLSALSLNSK